MYHLRSVFLLYFIQFFFFTGNILPQDTNIIKYFPLSVGNRWVYNIYGGYPINVHCISKTIITGSVLYNGKIFFQANTSIIHLENGNLCSGDMFTFNNSILRVDSLTGNIFIYTPGSGCNYSPDEKLIDSLKSRKNDTIKILCGSTTYKYRCIDTGMINVFGTNRQSRAYGFFEGAEHHGGRAYVKGIGLWNSNEGWTYTSWHQLLGAVINGIVYGDTSFPVGIIKISSEVPENFSLSQNYPNPFNPITKIKFNVPVDSRLRRNDKLELKVFDILGKEIASLIPPLWGGQEGLSPGTYEVEWDGSNYANGVYYYTLSSENFFQTKRMVLIK